MIHIDGSNGEGGGQILRTSLALSLCTGQPFRMTNIRAGRQKPGLLRQHLTAVDAATQIGQATVTGAEMGSRELKFVPGGVKPGNYRFSVGTAGSTTLVFQTILPALLTASSRSIVEFTGGTHNPYAPPFDFLEDAFAFQLRRMGAALRLSLTVPGFYPAGGGVFFAETEPAPALKPISLLEKGALQDQQATVYLANLPRGIADREMEALKKLLSWPEENFAVFEFNDSPGPGNAIVIREKHEQVVEVATSFGEKGVSAEHVARHAVEQLRKHQTSGAVVGEHLADQLLLPMVLAGSGEFRTRKPSSHAITNVQTIEKFLEVKITFREETPGAWLCSVG